MHRNSKSPPSTFLSSGIFPALMIAGVYGYFLLFSQFAFLEIVHTRVADDVKIKIVLACMAIGGLLGGFTVLKWQNPRSLRIGMCGCALAALLALLPLGLIGLAAISFFMGVSLGTTTVSLAGLLPGCLRGANRCQWAGIGTGLGYALCNVPTLFQASPSQQAVITCGMMGVALLASFFVAWDAPAQKSMQEISYRWWLIVVAFFALVWMDSAAFYVIQHAPDLKKATWGGEMLWRDAGLHFFSAWVAGLLLDRKKMRQVIISAVMILALASWWVNEESTRYLTGWCYPIGVSLYSTALIAWPGLIAGSLGSWQRAAWVFGIAGWIGSGQGIGMAENLQRLPSWFIIVALAVVIATLTSGNGKKSWWRRALLMVMGGVFFLSPKYDLRESSNDAIERGKNVYVAEGCIHCHSQYLRPGSIDESYWGESQQWEKIISAQPVLIGNRRQGPDLTNIAGRRSAVWLREHFIEPRQFNPNSSMPSYGYLFEDNRGNDLIAYLQADVGRSMNDSLARSAAWTGFPDDDRNVDLALGKKLFDEHCSVCHGLTAMGDGVMAQKFMKPPANLRAGPFSWSAIRPDENHEVTLQRIVRFGIPGTDMPGHETWTAEQVKSVAAYLLQLREN